MIRDTQNQIYVSRLIIPESFGVLGRMWRSGQLSLTLAAPQYPQFVLRALDAIQLATAISLRQTNPQIAFVCADQRLIALAQSAGITAIDPSTQP